MTEDGRTYHLGLKKGQINNRVLTVGDFLRAKRLSDLLDGDEELDIEISSRGFHTISGKYKGIPVSIVAIGMGMPMMDMFIREMRQITEGPLYIIRFGSCGSICEARLGDLVVASDAAAAIRNYDYFHSSNKDQLPYHISSRVKGDINLCKTLVDMLKASHGNDHVFAGLDVSADSFYSSQGRIDNNFIDHNKDLIETIKEKYEDAMIFEMETFMLYHLAYCSQLNEELILQNDSKNAIYASSVLMVFADRQTNGVVSSESIELMEKNGGKAIMDALICYTSPLLN